MFPDTLPSTRIKFLFAGFFVLSIVLSARLAYWQVLRRGDLLSQARAQVVQAETLAARRGAIYDQNGRLLATTVQLQSVYAPSAGGLDVGLGGLGLQFGYLFSLQR